MLAILDHGFMAYRESLLRIYNYYYSLDRYARNMQ